MTSQRKTDAEGRVRDVNAANVASRPTPSAFTLRVARQAAQPPPVPARAAKVQDPIERVMEEAPTDPRRPVRHGLLEQVFFDGDLELRLWWESDSPLSKSSIELR
jgi:hypothetical protein